MPKAITLCMDYVKLLEALSLKEKSSETASFYKSVCVHLNNVETEIVYADHVDKLLIFATQYQKVGSLLVVSKDQVENTLENGFDEPVYTVKPIFGVEDECQQAAARYIAEKLDIQKPLTIFLSLKSYDTELVKDITEILIVAKNNTT